jgi:hypothetical protein
VFACPATCRCSQVMCGGTPLMRAIRHVTAFNNLSTVVPLTPSYATLRPFAPMSH